MKDFKRLAEVMFMSSACASGHIKYNDWEKFLNSFEPKAEVKVEDTIEKMKKDGIFIEEN